MGDLMKRVMAWPWVAHLLRAVDRFVSRLGSQFAAAITYYSVLAIVPVLMIAFSILGLTIDVIRPDLASTMVQAINTRLESVGGADNIATTILDTLRSWRGVLIVALLPAGYAGIGWVGNIRASINAMWGSDGMNPTGPASVWAWAAGIGKNLAILVGLMVLGAVTVGVSLTATVAQSLVLGWLGLDGSRLASAVTVAAALLVSLLSGWLLFLYLYWILPNDHRPLRYLARGALFGSIGLAALQYFAGTLNGFFLQNKAALIFGPIIVLMLSLNVFATLVMLGAAWTATAGQADDPVAVDGGDLEPTMLPLAEDPRVAGLALVPQKVAKRGVTVGIVAGYALGGAAGLGLGAVLGRLAGAVVHRRQRRRSRG